MNEDDDGEVLLVVKRKKVIKETVKVKAVPRKRKVKVPVITTIKTTVS